MPTAVYKNMSRFIVALKSLIQALGVCYMSAETRF